MVNQVYVLVFYPFCCADSLRVSPEGIKTKEAEGSSNRIGLVATRPREAPLMSVRK